MQITDVKKMYLRENNGPQDAQRCPKMPEAAETVC